MAEPRVVILGGGPAGVGAAYALRRADKARVTLLEQGAVPGGNAGSFEWRGQRLDYGSHRLHPACEPHIMADIRSFLGEDLLDRPRHGRIGLMGRWIHFPLKPVDLLFRAPPSFGLGVAVDSLRKLAGRPAPAVEESFGSILEQSLGPTICREFYFPYGRKIWGRDPAELSSIQARRRVAASSLGKLVRKVLTQVPGFKPPYAGRFFYPRRGFGQISEAYAGEAVARGADVRYGARVVTLRPPANDLTPWAVTYEERGERRTIEADHVWSTIPITALARAMTEPPPDEVLRSADAISYRAMLLIYVALDVPRFTPFDAHYFPGANIRITRLSEPGNYTDLVRNSGQTILCAELPCSVDDPWWSMDDDALGALVAEDLATAGVPLPVAPSAVGVRRLRQAYPIYTTGYEVPFGRLDAYADSLPRFLTFGRQGLFAHDNTHHALAMAYAAAECLGPHGFDRTRWERHREVFATHVVED